MELQASTMAAAPVTVRNKQVKLKRFAPKTLSESDLEVQASEITLELRQGTGSKDVLVKNLYLSCDPYMRHRLTGLNYSHYPCFQIGQVLEGFGVSQVVASAHPDFHPGDYASSWTRWEEYSVIPEGRGLKHIDPSIRAPLSFNLGALGMPGFTAYVGLFEILKPKKGETIFVSAAAGAVGQVVGQLARDAGLYVVGSAGSKDKVDLLMNKLGYNTAFNYKEEEDHVAALKKHCPRGIDMYFENVGGKTLDAVIDTMNPFGRIAVCGLIAHWGEGSDFRKVEGLFNLYQVINKRITLQGFLQSDYPHLQPQFRSLMAGYLEEGRLEYVEDCAQGLDEAPNAFCRMMAGSKVGKQIVQVQEGGREGVSTLKSTHE